MTTTPNTIQAGSERVALLYLRVSTPHQAEEGASLDTQEHELRQLADVFTPELPVVVLREEGKSARSGKKRPMYEEAKRRIESGCVGAIYATKTDRLGRSVTEYLTLLSLCHDHDTAAYTKSGKIENTATGKLLAGILGVVAEFETDLRSERVREVNDYLRENGFCATSNVPWGLKRGPDRILYESEDGHLILEAFKRIDAGATEMQITRFLIGASKHERDTVDLTLVQRLLRNPVYAGYVVADTKSGAPRLIEGQHGPTHGRDPLVPRDLFERVQENLAAKKVTRSRGGSPISPLGELGRCGGCGAILRVKRLRDGGYAYFECNDACGQVKEIPTEQLELWLVAYLGALPGWIEAALESGEWRSVLGNAQEAKKIAARISELERGREGIRQLVRTGALAPDEARADLEASERELRKLRPEYEQHGASEALARADLERLASTLAYGFDGENIAQFWQRANVKEKRTALRSVLDRVDLLPDHVGLTFKYGLRAWADPTALCVGEPLAAFLTMQARNHGNASVTIPLYLPIARHRRTPKRTAEYEALGFLGLSFDVAPSRVAATGDSETRITADHPQHTESVAKSHPARRERSEGRSPSPPCAGPLERG